MYAWRSTITDNSGNIIPNATIIVREEASQSLVQLYSDVDGEDTIGNPIYADSEGFVEFFLPAGLYRITATSGAQVRDWRYVSIESGDLINKLASTEDGDGADLVGGAIKYITPKQFGAVGDGSTNDYAALQAMFNYQRDHGGIISFKNTTYLCNSALTHQRNTTDGPEFWIINGNGATIDFSQSGLISGNCFTLGATSQNNGHDTGFIRVENLFLLGPETGAPFSEDDPDGSTVGLNLVYAFNLSLLSVHADHFYIGIKTNNVYPLNGYDIHAKANFIGLYQEDNTTEGNWYGLNITSARFGVVQAPSASGIVQAQKFYGLRLEQVLAGFHGDPNSGSGAGIIGTEFYGPRIESLTYDGFRYGITWSFDTFDSRGADRSRTVFNPLLIGGMWDAGSGWNGTDHNPIVGPTANNLVIGAFFYIPAQPGDIIGIFAKSYIGNSPDPAVGATSHAVMPNTIVKSSTGNPTQSVMDGTICINETDNNAKIYAEGAWRSIATW